MHVALGSENPVKIAATERAAAALGSVEVVAAAVDSGVGEQPIGHEETRTGAENRAVGARTGLLETRPDLETPVLGVGLEGGVSPVVEGQQWLVMWAAATDGSRWGHGTGPSIPLPDRIAHRIDAGEELGPVMDDVLGQDGVKHAQGAAGALTGGVIDRESALLHAVAGALGPFATTYYD
jgi:inosine/xanthosine triphosphatase